MIALLTVLGVFVSLTHAALPANNQPTFHVFNHNDIYYFVDPKFEANFFGAVEFCKLNNMELAHIESPGQNEAIYKGLTKLIGNTRANFWTSGNRLAEGKEDFYWMSTGNKIGLSGYFGTGEPNNVKSQQCLQLFFNSGYPNGYWDDVQCDHVINVICQSSFVTN